MPDAPQAIVEILLADSGVAALASSRVYNAEIPEGEDKNMPEKTVIVRAAGGPAGFDTLSVDDRRLSILCYAETLHLAQTLFEAVDSALKSLGPSVHHNTYIHWAKKSVGPIVLRDPNEQWPYTTSSWIVRHSELAV